MWGIRMVNVVVSSVVMMMISSVVHIGNKGNVVTAFRSVVPTISSVSISQQQQQTNQFHQLSNNNNNYDNKLSTTSKYRSDGTDNMCQLIILNDNKHDN